MCLPGRRQVEDLLADILATDDPVGAQYTVTRGYLTITGLGWSC